MGEDQSDNNRGTYCAPAVATDGAHVYFIRMDRRKESRTVPVMRSADPASGRWEQCGELRRTGDPTLFFDHNRAWLYHGLSYPTKVFEIDRKTWTEIPGSERQLRPANTNLADLFGGYERGRRELLGEEDTSAWLGKFNQLPCQEAAWMTKHNGRYYLQYATPGTVTEWYCDTVMEGESATGPFRHVDYAPASLKVGGFMGSAGHSCVFQDKHGNFWRVTTMWVGVHDLFERRLGLFPVGFDAEGRMFTETALGDYRDAARNFWRYVVEERSYANGGNSNHEKFTPKAHLSLSLSKGNTETCNTHNMLKLTRLLFMWEPSSVTADYYERAQLNHILSSQHPKLGTVAYFHSLRTPEPMELTWAIPDTTPLAFPIENQGISMQLAQRWYQEDSTFPENPCGGSGVLSLESGNRKGFSPSWVTFACCHGSGMENHAKYGDSIYFHRGGERLFVNLFISSELNWKAAGLTVRQTTMFPEEAGTTLAIVAGSPLKTTLSIRKPFWAGAGFAVTVNGESVPTTTGAEGYVDIARTWKTGDKITVKLPMSLRWEGFTDDPDRAALLYGPVMLVAKTELGARYSVARKPADNALAALKPADKPLHFTGDPAVFQRDLASKPLSFLPLYQEYQDAYIAYWDLRDDTRMAADRATYDVEAKRWTQLAPRTLDIVFGDAGTPSASSTMPGRLAMDAALPRTAGTGRTEQQHKLEAHTGYSHEFNEPQRVIAGHWQTFRTTELGPDRFGWTLAVEPGKPQTLLVRLWSPPASDPDARRATNCGFEVRAVGVKSESAAVRKPQNSEATTEGNQLAAGTKARTLPPQTTLGTIGPAKADGTFRDVTFPISASLLADKDRLIVRLVRQGGKAGGMVAEVRLLRD